MADVLLIDEKQAADAIALALRPLSVIAVQSTADARRELARREFRATIIGYPRAQVRLDPKLRLAPPTSFDGRQRMGVLCKPFGQLDLARALETTWSETVTLQPLWSDAEKLALAGETLTLGPRGLAIAQVQNHWGWSNVQARVFRHYMELVHSAEVAKRLGLTTSAVDTHLTRATSAARKALGMGSLRKTDLRVWLLNRVIPPF